MLKKAFTRQGTRGLAALLLGAATGLVGVSVSTSAASALQGGPSAGPMHKMIVFLRAQNRGYPERSARHRAAVRAEQAPIIAYLHSSGVRAVTSLGLENVVIAPMTAGEASVLRAAPAVARVIPDGIIPGPSPFTITTHDAAGRSHASPRVRPRITLPSSFCGTVANPELDPEALANINATPAQLGGLDGAGVKVAYLADGVNAANPDFTRNAAYASAGSPTGSAVLTQVDFTGDGAAAPTAGGEAFGDSSSIAAQGNTVYDLSQFVNAAHPLPSGCDIKIVGSAPGASIEALKVFSANNDTTESNFLQAINYAVSSGAKVINESLGANQFPDTALDVTRDANDAAVAAGVTVVASTGDAGYASTIGSPATDPNVISVGATTTLRAYAQIGYGGITDPHSAGNFVDNNISSLSSGGFTQAGRTIDLVAPGDLNWALCDANVSLYADCTNENGAASSIELFGGTSESSPLTAGAAADVIQAYASTHGGADPSPALVKQILMSTATDLGAPAADQGAGLLNVLAAVKEAESIAGTTGTPKGGLLISPSQINVIQPPSSNASVTLHVTNTGASPVTVQLSSRALPSAATSPQSGSFCMQPGTATGSCPANTGTFHIWSGVTEVYQDVPFTVPATTGPSVLKFAADYPFTGQSSLMHFALIEPNGTYAAYSLPQGLGDFGQVEVTNPAAGAWTAVFFTEQDGATPGAVGTSGTIQWDASTFQYVTDGTPTPTSLTILAGATSSAIVDFVTPKTAGDTSQSLVLSTPGGTSTIPVVVRTMVPTSRTGGAFQGILTGGNGRGGSEAQTSTYEFRVPPHEPAVSVGMRLLTDPLNGFVAFLVDPSGKTVGYSTNVTTDNFGSIVSTPWANLYTLSPQTGRWFLVLDWLNPVSGLELRAPFTGTISFRPTVPTAKLPNATMHLRRGAEYRFRVNIQNNGASPEAYFVDPRLNHNQAVHLTDQNGFGAQTNMTLPLVPGLSFPYYLAPPDTARLTATISSTVPVTFDLEYFPGDPDVSPGVSAPGVASYLGASSASLSLAGSAVSPGLWLLNPSEIGPYGAGGAPSATASEHLVAITQAFDRSMTSTTGDYWAFANHLSNGFTPVYVSTGASANIIVTIKPTARAGSVVHGILYVDDVTISSQFGFALPDGDQIAAIPYSYTVAK